MAAFGIGTNTNIKNISVAGMRGKQVEVACDCWFSRKWKTLPQLIKYEDDNGEIQTLNYIRVISSEDKIYCGIRTREFNRQAEKDEIVFEFKLIFRKDECRWFVIR